MIGGSNSNTTLNTSVDEWAPSIRTVGLAALAIVLVQIIGGAAIIWQMKDMTEAGQFGDLFGAINTLFSGLAFAGLIYTAMLQRVELSLQRKELKETRVELARTAKAQEESEKALRAQAQAANQSANLSAINYLLDHYNSELAVFAGHAISNQDPRFARLTSLRERQRTLLQMLEKQFEQLTAKD